MMLDISEQEREYLIDLLQTALGDLREQVYHADTYDFKDQLKVRESLVVGLIEKLSGTAHPEHKDVSAD